MDSNGEEENNDKDYPEVSENEIQNQEENNDKLNINNKRIESSRDEMLKNEDKVEDKQTKENILEKEKEEEKKKQLEENEKKKKEEQNEEKKSEDLLVTLEKKVKLDIIITRTIDELKKDEERQFKIEELEEKNLESKERDDKNHLSNYKQSAINGNTLIQDPFAVFHGAETAYIDQFYKLSDLFVICPLYYNYRISLEYCTGENDGRKEYTAYHLFNTKETSPPCSHDCCENQAREIDINILNFTLEPEDKTRRIQKFVTLKKACRCAFLCFCACCTRPTFYVETPIDNLGKIVELRTGCDPTLNVLDINDDIAYVISATGCDCGYCCRDQCCDSRKCATCEFFIYDSKMKNKIGEIRKDHKSGRKMMPDYDQLKVIFPPEISCQDKILLVCAALVIEYLYFQNLSNSKRCRGTPRFLHSLSD